MGNTGTQDVAVAVGGVAVAGVPSAGQVPTAIDGTHASWQTGTSVQSVVPGANVTVDNTDPRNPVVASAVGGLSATTPIVCQFGGGQTTVVVAGVTTANPGVVTTTTPHGMAYNTYVSVAGVGGATQANGVNIATVLSPTTFSIPVNVTGTYTSGGTVTVLYVTSAYHGSMWPVGVNLPRFSWEWWACHTSPDSGGFLVSEGFGGAHAILFGFSPAIQGNIWTGSAITAIAGGYTAQIGEWFHARIGWDGTFVYVWINGILCNITPFAGPRQAQQGTVFVAGSDHSNFTGKIAMVRAFEGSCPLFTGASHHFVFTPERIFGSRWPSMVTSSNVAQSVAQFVAHYMGKPSGREIPDYGDGFAGRLHPGTLLNLTNGVASSLQPAPAPYWVADPTAPFSSLVEPARTRTFVPPVAAPGGVKIWDSVGRADSIPAFTSATVAGVVQTTAGSTEGGSLGPLVWQMYGPGPVGVFDNALICFDPNNSTILWVNNDSADMDIRADRRNAVGYASSAPIDGSQAYDLTIVFRMQDANNYLKAWVYHDQYANNFVRLSSVVGGGPTVLATWNLPNYTWTTLQIVASGSTVTGSVDGGQIGTQAGVTALQTQTKVGMLMGGTTAMRHKNFRVAA